MTSKPKTTKTLQNISFIFLFDHLEVVPFKCTISLVSQEERKDRKTRRGRSEEKVVGFNLAFLFPARKREVVTQGGTI